MDHCCTRGSWLRRGISLALHSSDTCLYEGLRETSFRATSFATDLRTDHRECCAAGIIGAQDAAERPRTPPPWEQGQRPASPTQDRGPGAQPRPVAPPRGSAEPSPPASSAPLRQPHWHAAPPAQPSDSRQQQGQAGSSGGASAYGRPSPAQPSAASSVRAPAQQPGSRGAGSGSASQVCCACSPHVPPHHITLTPAPFDCDLAVDPGNRDPHATITARRSPER